MPDNFTPLFSEILEEVAKAKTKNKKIQLLRKYETVELRMVLKGSFDPSIIWALPEGEVPYIPNDAPAGTEHTLLSKQVRILKNFIKGDVPNLTQGKREQMYIQLLEGLHESEAELMVAVKDKKVHTKYKGLSTNVVKEAFGWNDNFRIPKK